MGSQFNFNFIKGANFVSRLCQLATHQNIAVINQPLKARTAPALDSFGQKRVEALACLFGCYRESEMRILIDGRIHALSRTSKLKTSRAA
jgi:hypothetical protein